MPFDAVKLCVIIDRFPCLYNYILPEYFRKVRQIRLGKKSVKKE
jgi:hypothetical protein